MSFAEKIDGRTFDGVSTQSLERWLPWIGAAAAVFFLLYQLGGAALFEPDEGRNAEKARQILVLNDWITPHENFHAVLDKPIFFYWLIAITYKIFGASEWSARLPSALAALACAALVYGFARSRWGRWEALWAGLILLTSLEFFLLSRIVIFDMTLTLCQILALAGFYEAAQSRSAARRGLLCALMYLALGVGTLIKGLIGVVVPGMVIFFFLLLGNRWRLLRKLYPIPGALLFFAVVLPWYLQAEAHNPGYLSYYIWQEHFGRYTTGQFDRTESWYYFMLVLLVGFFPWTFLLPQVAKDCWKNRSDEKTLFVVLWIVLPFLFFSVSHSKLPHYILPVFPPLAIITGAMLVRPYRQSAGKLRSALALTWLAHIANAAYLSAGTVFPRMLPREIRGIVGDVPYSAWFYLFLAVAVLCYMLWGKGRQSDQQPAMLLIHGLGTGFFLIVLAHLMVAMAPLRSAKALAQGVRPHLTAATEIVFFDMYLAGTAFYLQTQKPIWFVTNPNKKRTFLGNYYALTNRSEPSTAWGKTVLDFDEFSARWHAASQPILVIVKEKNLPRLAEDLGEMPRRIGAVDEYALVAKP